MKAINKIYGLAIAATGLLTASCGEDFLDKAPLHSYTGDTYYASDAAVLKSVEPLYNYAWFNYNRRGMAGMGSYRANDAWNPYFQAEFAKFQLTGLQSDLADAWSSLYMVIELSNQLLIDVSQNCSSDVSDEVKNLALGEAYMMRATAYFYLVRAWGEVPVYEDNFSIIEQPIVPLIKEEDVLKFVVRDYRKAIELLPATSTDNHATRYAAEALLAKALLAQSGWNQSQRDETILAEVVSLCNDVINNGPYRLMDDYEDLWKYANNDNQETILAMRWADPLTGEWGAMNANYSDLAWSGISDVNVWGGSYASIDMIDLYNEEPGDSIRLRATFFSPGRYYDYIDTGNALVKASDKTAENGYPQPSGYVYNKKHMQLKKYVVGTKADCGGHLAQMASPMNTYIMRMADVYLIKAEALLGNAESTDNPEGREALNFLRRRAHAKELKSYSLETLIRERRIEFCMEFQNWYDMVSWYRWKPQYMLNYFNNKQHRGFQLNENYIMLKEDGTIAYAPIPPLAQGSWYFKDYSTPDELTWWNDGWRNNNGDLVPGMEHLTLDEMCRKEALYQPIILSETNIFMPYPESDVLRNPFFNQEAQNYDFTW